MPSLSFLAEVLWHVPILELAQGFVTLATHEATVGPPVLDSGWQLHRSFTLNGLVTGFSKPILTVFPMSIIRIASQPNMNLWQLLGLATVALNGRYEAQKRTRLCARYSSPEHSHPSMRLYIILRVRADRSCETEMD
jgi:hypothetical protein